MLELRSRIKYVQAKRTINNIIREMKSTEFLFEGNDEANKKNMRVDTTNLSFIR